MSEGSRVGMRLGRWVKVRLYKVLKVIVRRRIFIVRGIGSFRGF